MKTINCKKMKKIRFTFIIMCMLLISMPACNKILDVKPDSSNLLITQTFKTKDDALSAFTGCYALMQNVVDQIYIAGEMQGELVSPARGCDSIPFLKQILNNDVNPQNPYTDYSKFYKLIAACNGAIQGYDNLCNINPDFGSDLRDLYKAHAIIIRAWTYLQLVKIWGDVPYISNNVYDLSTLTDVAASPSSEILTKIANDVNLQLPRSDVFVSNGTNMFTYPTVRMLLCEIYMWNQQYENAYDIVKKFLPFINNPPFSVDGSQVFYSYFESFRYAGTAWLTKYNFSKANSNVTAGQYIAFDGTRGQKNSIVRWCNNRGNSIYAIKPSTWAIKNWAMQPRDSMLCWLAPMNRNQNWPELPNKGFLASKFKGDWFRGGGGTFINGNDTYTVTAGSYLVDGTDTIIAKPLIKTPTSVNVNITAWGINGTPGAFVSAVTLYNVTRRSALNLDPYTQDDLQFGLWGEGWVQLWTAELLNQLGRSREALTILNTRGGNLSSIRRRVGLTPLLTDVVDDGNMKRKVDDAILNEMSLESAFEGYRWFDLVRFAKRYNDPTIIANTVALKYPASQQAIIKSRLSDPNRWFFPYYYKNVQANKLLTQKHGY